MIEISDDPVETKSSAVLKQKIKEPKVQVSGWQESFKIVNMDFRA